MSYDASVPRASFSRYGTATNGIKRLPSRKPYDERRALAISGESLFGRFALSSEGDVDELHRIKSPCLAISGDGISEEGCFQASRFAQIVGKAYWAILPFQV